MENAPNLHSDKKIATTATQFRNDSNDFSGCLKQNNNTAVGWVSNPPTTPTGVDNTNIITDNANIDFAPNGAMVGRRPYNANRTLNRHCERVKRAWQSPCYGKRTKLTQRQGDCHDCYARLQ
ncbi:MAG: hypothetical protein IJR46_03710 [Neisseriaceae bacterium]|nr:hypothetical protein [Neisseriaceae bacterium]